MSKFYDRTLKASNPKGEPPVETSIVDRWLEGIHDTVAEQVGGVEPSTVVAAPAVLSEIDAEVAELRRSPAEFSFDLCRRTELRARARVMLPGTPLEHHAIDAYRVMRTRLMRRGIGSSARVIAVSGAGQGDGKTITAINLASIWSQLITPRVLLVDADLRSAGLSDTLDVPTTPGLADVLRQQSTYQEAVLATQVANLFVLPAGTQPESTPECFAADTWKEFVRWASSTFDLVILDCPPMIPFPDYELISATADGVIAVARQHRTDATLFKTALAQTDPKKIVGIVFNAVDDAPVIDYNSYSNYSRRKT